MRKGVLNFATAMSLFCAMAFCYSCSDDGDDLRKRWVTRFDGYVGDEIALNDTLFIRYGIFTPDSAEVSFYLCGPMNPNDESLSYSTYNAGDEYLDKLYGRTNARLINDQFTFVWSRYGYYDWYWIPKPELVEVGKIYLLVVDIRFLDDRKYHNGSALYSLLMLNPIDNGEQDE